LFAEEVGFRFFGKVVSRTPARCSRCTSIGKKRGALAFRIVLLDGKKAGVYRAFGEDFAHTVAGGLGATMDTSWWRAA